MVRGLHPKDAMVTTPQETAKAAPAVDFSLEDVEGSETAQLGSRSTNELHTSDRTDAPRAT